VLPVASDHAKRDAQPCPRQAADMIHVPALLRTRDQSRIIVALPERRMSGSLRPIRGQEDQEAETLPNLRKPCDS
jgi:hypothetical protein